MNIASRLLAHLLGDGTINDSETGDLFREAHHLSDDEETDLETVERWAVQTAERETQRRRTRGEGEGRGSAAAAAIERAWIDGGPRMRSNVKEVKPWSS